MNSTSGASVIATPPTGGFAPIYTVTASNAGCSATATIVVNVLSAMVVTVNSETVCPGTTVNLTASSNYSGTSFLWSNGQTGNTISVSPTSTTTYTVTGSISYGCVGSAVSNITVFALPQNSGFSNSNPTICPGSSTCFSAFEPNLPNTTYIFTSGDGQTITSQNGLNVCFTYNTPGTYYPGLTISQNGCQSQTIYGVVNVVFDVDITPSIQICGDLTLEANSFRCIRSKDLIYTWTYNGVNSYGNPVNFPVPPGASSASINLTITDANTGIVLYTSGYTTYTFPPQPANCCANNTLCTGSTCTQVNWSGEITFPPIAMTYSNTAFTVAPNTIIKIPSHANITFNNCTFLMLEGSSFQISKYLTGLSFNNCYLHGCTRLWDGIKNLQIDPPSFPPAPTVINVSFTNSMIEDAVCAFDLAQSGIITNLTLNSAILNKNITGIEIYATPNAGSGYNTLNITNTAFTCKQYSFSASNFSNGQSTYTNTLASASDAIPLTKTSLPYYSKSLTGIIVYGLHVPWSSPNTYWGDGIGMHITNGLIYDNLVQGVNVEGVDLSRFEKNIFNNINVPNGAGSGIYYNNQSAAIAFTGRSYVNTSFPYIPGYQTNKIGFTNASASHRNTFTNCYYGVYTRDEPVDVTFNDFTDCENGVYVGNAQVTSNGGSNANVNCTIKGNNMTRVGNTGVFMDKNVSINAEISSNHVVNTSGLNYTSYGVQLVEANAPTSAKYNVLNNYFTDTWQGAKAILVYNPIFTNNQIKLNTNNNPPQLTVNNAPYNNGIYLTSCEAAQVNENHISNSVNAGTWWEQGIVSVLSRTAHFYCNDINGTFSGITTGDDCFGSLIYYNDIHNAQIAHWLIFGNKIGYNYNPNLSSTTSPGFNPTSAAPADNRYYNIGTYYSWAQNLTDGQSDVLFYVRAGALYNIPDPYNLAESGSSKMNILSPTAPNNNYTRNYCSSGNSGNSPLRLMAVAKAIATDALVPASDLRNKYISRQQLLSNLQKDNIGTTGDASIDSFAASISNEPVTQLFKVDMAIQQSTNSGDTLFASADSINSSLSPTDSISLLQRSVNNVYLDYLKKGGKLDAIDISTLQPIAALCPYIYGSVIWEARAILVGYDNTEYFNLCEYYSAPDNIQQNGRMARVIEEAGDDENNTVLVYPNPNTGSFKIELPAEWGNVNIEIINVMGAIVKSTTHNIQEKGNIVEVEDMQQGIYFVMIKANNITLASKKVVITK